MAEQQKASEAKEEAPKFDRDRLVAEADTLGLDAPRHVVAGALSDLKGTGDVTLDEAKKAVETYRKREIKEA